MDDKYPMVLSARACPICGGRNVTMLKRMTFAVENGSVLPPFYRIVCCEGCGFVYDDVDVGPDVFSRYYEESGKYVQIGIGGSGDITPNDRIRYQDIIDFIRPLLPAKSIRIADVGCGKGGLLRMFRENGYGNVCGIEPSSGCVQLMRERYGMRAICAGILDVPRDEVFDLIVVSNVFEHLYSVHDAIEAIDAILAPGGLAYVDVPDASRYWRHFYAPYYSFDMEHINHFNVETMSALWAGHGYGNVKFSETVGTPVTGRQIPMCRVLLQKGRQSEKCHSSITLRDGILRFVEMSAEAEIRCDAMKTITGPVCYWGFGAYAKWMLDHFAGTNIGSPVCIADAGANERDRRTVKGIPIISPRNLHDVVSDQASVLITSVLYEDQIRRALSEMAWTGPIYSASTGSRL